MFERFIELAHSEGVTRAENLPFWLEPESAPNASVVLIHGFSATPHEMRPLAEALQAAGFAACGVRLPGHGTSPEDLARRSYDEWVATIRSAIDIAAGHTPRVYAAGLSTGALALLAAVRDRHLDGLALLAPFLRLHHPLAPFVRFLRYVKRFELREVEAELQPFYYARRPLQAIHQLILLTKLVRRLLPGIKSPALVLASEGDATADHTSAIELFERLGSIDKQLHLFGAEVPHTMLGDDNPQREAVIRLCLEFFLAAEAAPRGAAR